MVKKWWDDGGLLKLGTGNYLERQTDNPLVHVFGHPYVQDPGAGLTRNGYPEFRISPGIERYPEDQDTTPDHYIFYDSETIGGNSGSPLVGSFSIDGQMEVKGIHILGAAGNKQLNSAQGFKHCEEWLEPQATSASSINSSRGSSGSMRVPVDVTIIHKTQLKGSQGRDNRRSRKNKGKRLTPVRKTGGARFTNSDTPGATPLQPSYSFDLLHILLFFLIFVVVSAFLYHL